MRLLKQSTERNLLVFMTDSTDHITGKTGLTLTITASKNGAAFASISPTVTERGDGWYSLALTSSHTDTLGDLAIHITGTAADPSDLVTQVVEELPLTAVTIAAAVWNHLTTSISTVGSIGKLVEDNLDAAVSAIKAKTDLIPATPASQADVTSVGANVTSILGYVDTEIAAIKAKTDNLPAAPASTSDVTTVGTAVAAVNTKLGTPAEASVSADIALALKTSEFIALIDA